MWSAEALDEVRVLYGHTDVVTAVAFFHKGQTLVTAGWDRQAIVWDFRDGKQRFALTGHTAALEAVAVSPDDKLVATAGADQTIRLWDAQTGVEVAVLQSEDSQVRAVAFSPDDGKLLVAACADARPALLGRSHPRRPPVP